LRIETDYQRNVLDRAKAMVANDVESIGDPTLSLAQMKTRYYSVLRQAGITRANGITSHGLRHGVANDQYARLTGSVSPVRGGSERVDAARDHAARMEIAENLGHSREDVTTHYLGR
jgi:integrase